MSTIFLGFRYCVLPLGFFLSQHKYVTGLLHKLYLYTLKLVCTLHVSRTTLSLTNGELLADPSKYSSMVGALQYLTMARLDIAYDIQVVSQFMHAPYTSHLIAVKRIFRYLQGTAEHGLFFKSSSRLDRVVAVCDADWVGGPDSCRTTTGFAIF